MSRVRANEYTNFSANGAPLFPHGVVVSGFTTFQNSVSIGGTLTYEDVTSIDSVGIITANSGINVPGGGVVVTGVVTATTFKGDGSELSGVQSTGSDWRDTSLF